jgi:hypothetical protein
MKKLMILVISVITPLILAAQVQLMDLSIFPIETNSVDSVELAITFKMNPVAQAQTIQFSFGTQIGSNDVFTGIANIVNTGISFNVNYGSESTPVENYHVQVFCKLTQNQYSQWQHLTVFVLDINGSQSNVLMFNK